MFLTQDTLTPCSFEGIRVLKKIFVSSVAALTLVCTSYPDTVGAIPRRGFTVSPSITEPDIEDLAHWNVTVVRYHLQWDSTANTATSEEYLAWLDGALVKFDEVLEWCKARKMSVVLNIHTPPGGFKRTQEPALHRLFVEDWAYDTLVQAWTRIAVRYQGESTIVGYDILNEPAITPGYPVSRSWASVANAIGTLINSIDPSKKLVVEPVYGNPGRMSTVKSVKLPGLVLSPHLYYPWKFVHQGLYGVPIKFKYPTKKIGRAQLVKSLRPVLKYASQKKVGVYVGEFTAVRWAPDGSAVRYLRDMVNLMERLRWDWTYHAFREADPWDLERPSNFWDSLRTSKDTDRLTLMKRFLGKNQGSNPLQIEAPSVRPTIIQRTGKVPEPLPNS